MRAPFVQKSEVQDAKVREETTPAVQARDQPPAAAGPTPAAKSGYGAGAIAATFFGGLVLGVLAIIAAVKLHRKKKLDEFYAGASLAHWGPAVFSLHMPPSVSGIVPFSDHL